MSAPRTSSLVDVVDTTLRDGNQSLWSATGLTTSDIVAIAPTIDRVGFRAVDFTSSTHMAVAVRFHREDPWERLRLVRAAMPETRLGFITTGMRFITWVPVDEDVMRLAFRCVVRNGIRRFQFADPSNDPVRLRRVAALAHEEGVEEVIIGLTYSISEVHTHAYYAERAAALADCADMDGLYLKDPGGLLTQAAVQELAPHFLRAARWAPGRAAQPLHDRPRAVRLRGGAARRVRRAPHRRRAPGPRDVQPGRRDDASRPGGGGLLAPPGRRRSRRDVGVLPGARAREGPSGRRAAGVRLDLLPPPARGRDGLHDAADARRAAQARAVPPRARGGRPRTGGDGIPDHRHAGVAARCDTGGAERHRRRALVERLGRDRPLLPRPLRRPGRARRPRRRRPRPLPAARRGAERARAAPARGSTSPLPAGDLRRGAAPASDDARGTGGRDARVAPRCRQDEGGRQGQGATPW